MSLIPHHDRTGHEDPARAESSGRSTDDTSPRTYDDHSVAVVVPAYNEADHVGEVLDTIPPYVDRIYAVDDRSTDGTWAEIQRRVPGDAPDDPAEQRRKADDDRVPARVSVTDGGATVDDRIVPIRHDENQGAGAGIRTGYRHAHEDGMDVTVAMDGDGQMDPSHMPDLIDPIVEGEAEYAKGNRLANADYRDGMPGFRLFGNWLLTLLTKIASGYWRTMDPQNGYTAISGDALAAIDIDAIPAGHDYTNHLLVRLNVAGARVADVSMPAVYGDETSTIDYTRFAPRTSLTLLSAFCWRLERTYLTRDFHPLVFFYGLGAASVAAAVGWALGALRREDGVAVPLLGATVSALFGCLFVVTAMVLDERDNEGEEVRRE